MTQSAVFQRNTPQDADYDEGMDETPHGFWSYVHDDNEGMHGAIRRVAEHVQAEYGVITGGLTLDLFLDNMKLKWGDKWRDRIREAVEQSTFFIPIITPRYFKSEECRRELMGFADQAQKMGREALIMPLYFVEVPELEAGNSDDPMIKLVADSQMKDWRTLRFLDLTTQPYRLALNELATRLVAISKERETATPAQPAPVEDDEDEQQAVATSPPGSSSSHANGDGMLEQIVEGEEALPRLVATLSAITQEIETVGELAVEATKDIEGKNSQGAGFKERLAITHRLAKQLDGPVDQLERLTSEYVADLLLVDPAIRHMIGLATQPGIDADERADFFSSIGAMIDGSEKGAEGITEMIESMGQATNLSRELDIPLNRLRASLQSMLDSNRRMDTWRAEIDAAGDGVTG